MKTKTEQIFELSCPYDNQYQGTAVRYLFVCSAGLLRSPTAAKVAILHGYNARSCGSAYAYALIPISVNLIHWAQKIFFLNVGNYDEALLNFFGDTETCNMIRNKSLIWDIEDDYNYDDFTLRQKIEALLA